MSDSHPTTEQKLVASDKYKKFLAVGDKPKSVFFNPQNMFDNSNMNDKKWFNIAWNYLNRKRS